MKAKAIIWFLPLFFVSFWGTAQTVVLQNEDEVKGKIFKQQWLNGSLSTPTITLNFESSYGGSSEVDFTVQLYVEDALVKKSSIIHLDTNTRNTSYSLEFPASAQGVAQKEISIRRELVNCNSNCTIEIGSFNFSYLPIPAAPDLEATLLFDNSIALLKAKTNRSRVFGASAFQYHTYFRRVFNEVDITNQYSINQADSISIQAERGLYKVWTRMEYKGEMSDKSEETEQWIVLKEDSPKGKIIGYEYWYDDLPKERHSLSQQEELDVNIPLETNDLSIGLHVFHIRFQDSNGQWSVVKTSYFIKAHSGTIPQNAITGFEYWWGDQATEKTWVPSEEGKEIFNISLPTTPLPLGLNIFNLRVKDKRGNWSVVKTSYFIKPHNGIVAQNAILGYEYWWNNNTNEKTWVSSSGSDGIYAVSLPTNSLSLPLGLNTIHIRFKDKRGQWSTVTSKYFFKEREYTTNNKIQGYRYWFDQSIENHVLKELNAPVKELSSELNISIPDSIKHGFHTFNIQYQDLNGLYSQVSSDTFFIGLEDGLIAYYNFSENAYDLSGNGFDGQVSGVTPIKDRHGSDNSAYTFDGVNDIITIPHTPQFNFDQFTLMAWVKVGEYTNYAKIIDKFDYIKKSGYALSFQGPNVLFNGELLCEFFNTEGKIYSLLSKGTYNDDNWHFVVGTYDQSTLSLYVDGKLESSKRANGKINVNTKNLTIGNGFDRTRNHPLKGAIDEVKIYNIALPLEEIEYIYQLESNHIEQDLVAHYPLDSLIEIADFSGNNYHLDTISRGTPAKDRFGNDSSAIYFDGVDDTYSIQGDLNFKQKEFSVSCWFKTDYENTRLVSKYSWDFREGYSLGVSKTQNGKLSIMYTNNTLLGLETKNPVIDNKWHHIVGVITKDSAFLYLDGELQQKNKLELTLYHCENPFTIGSSENKEFFKGSMDDVRVYKKALTPFEVAMLYESGENQADQFSKIYAFSKLEHHRQGSFIQTSGKAQSNNGVAEVTAKYSQESTNMELTIPVALTGENNGQNERTINHLFNPYENGFEKGQISIEYFLTDNNNKITSLFTETIDYQVQTQVITISPQEVIEGENFTFTVEGQNLPENFQLYIENFTLEKVNSTERTATFTGKAPNLLNTHTCYFEDGEGNSIKSVEFKITVVSNKVEAYIPNVYNLTMGETGVLYGEGKNIPEYLEVTVSNAVVHNFKRINDNSFEVETTPKSAGPSTGQILHNGKILNKFNFHSLKNEPNIWLNTNELIFDEDILVNQQLEVVNTGFKPLIIDKIDFPDHLIQVKDLQLPLEVDAKDKTTLELTRNTNDNFVNENLILHTNIGVQTVELKYTKETWISVIIPPFTMPEMSFYVQKYTDSFELHDKITSSKIAQVLIKDKDGTEVQRVENYSESFQINFIPENNVSYTIEVYGLDYDGESVYWESNIILTDHKKHRVMCPIEDYSAAKYIISYLSNFQLDDKLTDVYNLKFKKNKYDVKQLTQYLNTFSSVDDQQGVNAKKLTVFSRELYTFSVFLLEQNRLFELMGENAFAFLESLMSVAISNTKLRGAGLTQAREQISLFRRTLNFFSGKVETKSETVNDFVNNFFATAFIPHLNEYSEVFNSKKKLPEYLTDYTDLQSNLQLTVYILEDKSKDEAAELIGLLTKNYLKTLAFYTYIEDTKGLLRNIINVSDQQSSTYLDSYRELIEYQFFLNEHYVLYNKGTLGLDWDKFNEQLFYNIEDNEVLAVTEELVNYANDLTLGKVPKLKAASLAIKGVRTAVDFGQARFYLNAYQKNRINVISRFK